MAKVAACSIHFFRPDGELVRADAPTLNYAFALDAETGEVSFSFRPADSENGKASEPGARKLEVCSDCYGTFMGSFGAFVGLMRGTEKWASLQDEDPIPEVEEDDDIIKEEDSEDFEPTGDDDEDQDDEDDEEEGDETDELEEEDDEDDELEEEAPEEEAPANGKKHMTAADYLTAAGSDDPYAPKKPEPAPQPAPKPAPARGAKGAKVNPPKAPANGRITNVMKEERKRVIRAWADENAETLGLEAPLVGARGRIPGPVETAFYEAHTDLSPQGYK